MEFKQYIWVGLVCGISLLPLKSFACEQSAITPLEKLYCQITAKGEAAGLPSFDDFRRNPEATQRLLLKRPAKRAGLNLPASQERALPSAPQKQPAAKIATRAIPTSLKHCQFNAPASVATPLAMQCGNVRYTLLDNLTNAQLAAGALTEQNTLQLPPVPAYRTTLELHDYLQHAYAEYLTKMHVIGLAGATLSYSKFYYIFDETRQQKNDFVKRFASMYSYLKKDKSTIAIARAHKNSQLPALASCEPIGADFITCDEQGKNWVFKL